MANALEVIFPNIRLLGSLFHHSMNVRKNIKDRVNIDKYKYDKDINLTEEKFKLKNENFINDILIIPFEIQNNENIIEIISNNYKNEYLI